MTAPAVSMSAAGAQRRFRTEVAVALLAVVWLSFTIGLRPLSLPEEGRYVGVAWEMLRSGDWLTPTENGLPFFHKPPLFYWITAASMAVFGPSPAAARLAPLLGALGGTAVFAHVVARRVGDRAALWTVAVLLATPAFFAAAQFANLDMLVAGCIAAAIALAADGALRIEAGEASSAVVVGAWVAAALGVLAKGLIGIVLPGLVVLAWLLLDKRWRTALRLVANPGPVAFAAVAAPWFVAMAMRHPGFADFFFLVQHVERFADAGGAFNSVQPWWFYLACLPVLGLPWTPWLLLRARGGAKAPPTADARWTRLLLTWLVVVLAFFSFPASKPVGYAMPVLFPIAALVAQAVVRHLDHAGDARGRRRAAACLAVGALLCGAAVVAAVRLDRHGNADVAEALRGHRSPGDAVVFVGDYFFDVPLLAGLDVPVAVVSDWHDPAIARHDNWKRELWEGAHVAPALGRERLVETTDAAIPRCGPPRPVWVIATGRTAPDGLQDPVAVMVGARSTLWRVVPGPCG